MFTAKGGEFVRYVPKADVFLASGSRVETCGPKTLERNHPGTRPRVAGPLGTGDGSTPQPAADGLDTDATSLRSLLNGDVHLVHHAPSPARKGPAVSAEALPPRHLPLRPASCPTYAAVAYGTRSGNGAFGDLARPFRTHALAHHGCACDQRSVGTPGVACSTALDWSPARHRVHPLRPHWARIRPLSRLPGEP